MLRKYLAIFVVWTALVGASLTWNLRQVERSSLNTAIAAARASLAKDIGFRNWASSHGGVYVPPTELTPSNPFLGDPQRDVVTTSGLKLTLMNPAYLIREVQENFGGDLGIKSHLTSLKLLNPKNAPDEWETRALESFERGAKEALEISSLDGKAHLRLMRPLTVSIACLKCHGHQKYRDGDVRGGIGAYVLLQPYTDIQLAHSQELSKSHGAIWFMGLLGLVGYFRSEKSYLVRRKLDDEHIQNLAYFDTLTKLPNRRLLMDRLQESMLASARNKLFGAVLFLDLDHFKTLNDTLGHDFGDLLLMEVATRVQQCVREVDTVARMGGDEFVVLLNALEDDIQNASHHVAVIAEKIRKSLATPYQLDGKEYLGSSSIGVCLYRGNDLPVKDVLKHTDMAMYRAKASGRNAVRFFDPSMQLAVQERAALEADLRRAVPDHQLRLHYQIQVNNEHRPIGAEALVRWLHPTRGLVSPAAFIQVAEESSLILDIGNWVLDTACQQLSAWSGADCTRDLTLAVNVSAQQFKQPDFVDNVVNAVRDHEVDPSRLKIELTESMVLSDVIDIVAKMHALRALGVGLSMDDFGTGYSSLSYLKQLPLDQLKIDQSFVRDMTCDPNDAQMVRTIIDLAKNFHLNVIAEGVETEAQLSLLMQMGCMAYQGYFFSKPVPIERFEILVRGL